MKISILVADTGLYCGDASGVALGSEAVYWDFSIVQTV